VHVFAGPWSELVHQPPASRIVQAILRGGSAQNIAIKVGQGPVEPWRWQSVSVVVLASSADVSLHSPIEQTR
jgi:hypothetical protein